MKYLSLRTRLRLRFWRVRRWVTRIRNALTGSIIVSVARTNGDDFYGESVYSVTCTLNGNLVIIHKDGSETVIPFEELNIFVVTAY